MIAIAYIKTQCSEFRGIETVLVPNDYAIIGFIYKREENQCWCVCKGDNIMDTSIESLEIAKSVLALSIERKITYSEALEFYFDILNETEAIENKNLNDFQKLLLQELKLIDPNLIWKYQEIDLLIEMDITDSALELALSKLIGGEYADKLMYFLENQRS